MTPEIFDALIDLIDHKLWNMRKMGSPHSAKLLSKQGRLRAMIEKESAAEIAAAPEVEVQSELLEQLETKLAAHQVARMNLMMSDDRAFSNGRLSELDKEGLQIKIAIEALKGRSK